MAELTDVIKGALDSATAEPTDTGGDADVSDATGEADSGAESSIETAGDSAAPEAEAAPTAEATTEAAPVVPQAEPVDSDLAREMEALGLKQIAGKDNRIPYSRVMKIVDNARKRAAEEHKKALEDRNREYEQAQQELNNFRAVDQLIQSDHRRYLEMLAQHVPAYQQYLQPQQPAQPAPGQEMPQPDTKFPDGSPGYSPEQHAKLLDWIGRQAEERAVKRVQGEYSQRLAPIEQRLQAEQRQQQDAWRLQQEVAEVHDMWGKELVEANKDAILDYINKNPSVSVRIAAARVLRPKLHNDRTRLREEWMKELEQRPKAAAPTPSTSTKTPTPTGPRSAEDVVKEAVASLRR